MVKNSAEIKFAIYFAEYSTVLRVGTTSDRQVGQTQKAHKHGIISVNFDGTLGIELFSG